MPNFSQANPSKGGKVSCQNCSLSELCLPQGLSSDELDKLETIIKPSRLMGRGEKLYRAGQPFKSLYAVRSGSFRTYLTTESGKEQVTAFYLPGELFGLDGIENDNYACTADALENSSVCELPFDNFDEYCCLLPGFRKQFVRIVGNQITTDQRMLLLLGKLNANARLASFLLSLSTRLKQRGYSDKAFNLSMPRHDLANYLGLAVETLSRLFKRFQNKGILQVQGRSIEILDRNELSVLAESCVTPCGHKMKDAS